jgi:hypothetical protein
MAAWLPVLKTALPYVSNIVAAALPVFTSRKEHDVSADLVAQQIAELQEAVRGNAEAVKGLAAQVEQTITALDAGEADLAQRLGSLQHALARCDNLAAAAQAQVTRLEGGLAAMDMRVGAMERQAAVQGRRQVFLAAVAGLAMLVALAAVLL